MAALAQIKLTKRQRNFMQAIAAEGDEGLDPWEMERGILRSHEIKPLIDGDLIAFDPSIDRWFLTTEGNVIVGATS